MLLSLAYTRPLFVVVRKLNVVDVTAWTGMISICSQGNYSSYSLFAGLCKYQPRWRPSYRVTDAEGSGRTTSYLISLLLVDYAGDLTA